MGLVRLGGVSIWNGVFGTTLLLLQAVMESHFSAAALFLAGAVAGLVAGEEGPRRSSRQRYRPLEFWRNERKVYGREYNSLPTVVGVEVRTPAPTWHAEDGAKNKHRKPSKVPIRKWR